MTSELLTYETYIHPISHEVYNIEVLCTTAIMLELHLRGNFARV